MYANWDKRRQLRMLLFCADKKFLAVLSWKKFQNTSIICHNFYADKKFLAVLSWKKFQNTSIICHNFYVTRACDIVFFFLSTWSLAFDLHLSHFSLLFCSINKGSISFVINDGSWHHITVVWHGSSKSWTLFSDGVNRGRQTKNNWNESLVLSSATLFIGRKPTKDSSKLFSGRITQFNMWDHELEEEKITMLARGCKSEPGNMIQWSNLRSKVEGELRIVEPSSCTYSGSYSHLVLLTSFTVALCYFS